MSRTHCVLCGCDLGENREGFYYCEPCLHKAMSAGSHRFWLGTVAAFVIMISVSLLLSLTAPALSITMSNVGRLLLGLFLTFIPGLLWLYFFYKQDRLEPEPKHYVLGVFILGGLLGGAVEQPLVRHIFELQRWIEPGSVNHLLSALLLSGILTASLTYLAVRFSVMATDEFDERVDGIIYGTAAALGLGVAANLTYLLDNRTISLSTGVLHLVTNSLAYATFGAIVGFFLGLIRPGGGSVWLAPLGVLIAGVLHSIYEWIDAQLGTSGLSYNPWPAFLWALIFAVLSFISVFLLLRHAYRARMINPAKGQAL